MNALNPLAYPATAEALVPRRAYPAPWFTRPVLAFDCEDPAHLITRLDREAFVRMANLRAGLEEERIQEWQRTFPQHPLGKHPDLWAEPPETAEDVRRSLRMWGCVFLGGAAFWGAVGAYALGWL